MFTFSLVPEMEITFLNVFWDTKSKSARQNDLSGQVFEKNGVEILQKCVFYYLWKFIADESNVQETSNRTQIKGWILYFDIKISNLL